MKKLTLAFAATLFILTSCGSKEHKHEESGTHTHEDGSTHADHEQDTTQQEFEVKNDTTAHN
jgi:protein involved in sex pheromone biosynthesis